MWVLVPWLVSLQENKHTGCGCGEAERVPCDNRRRDESDTAASQVHQELPATMRCWKRQRIILYRFQKEHDSVDLLWLCLTVWFFCDPMDCSPPGSSVHGISQARILEWVLFPSPGDLPDPGIESACPALAGGVFTPKPPGKPLYWHINFGFCSL